MPYVPSGSPAYRSGPSGTSAAMRSEFVLIQTETDKLSKYAGNGGLFLRVNAGGTGYEAISAATALASLVPNSAALAAAVGDETGTGVVVFGTSPTIATPVINGLPTGTGVATANTASTLVARDASGNFTAGTITAALTGSISGNAATVTTNANLTGPITSVGNGTAIADAALSIAKTSGLQVALDARQPLDAALTALAAGSDFVQFTGPATATKVFTLPDASSTLLVSGGALGTPSSGVATNLTGTAAALNIGGNATTATTASIPQNSKSDAYTTVLGDANKHILHPTADNNARTFTIDSNANVAYAIGTTLTFVNQINTVTIAITTDTLTWLPSVTTGSRTLAAGGMATALKVSDTGWVITGVGIS